jgi:hypothetical protein
MTAFATAEDLGNRLRRTFQEGDESDWITELLEDASEHIRGEIGQKVFPRTTSTYTAYPTNGREDLPQVPVVAVTGVTRDGHDVPFTTRPGRVLVDGDDPCDITFTWGYENAPRELTRVACVLVSSTLITLEAQLGLTAGGLSSAQIDEFRLAWANAGEQSGMEIPPRLLDSLRRQFGRGDVHVVETNG